MSRRCTYGPVPSRRLGLSLGVDLVPFKVCCYDCLYCQVGRTTDHTITRRDFIDPEQVAQEVEQALHGSVLPDCITLSGSGEPTLHSRLDEVAARLRGVTQLPLVLLTNGGLLWDDKVAEAAGRFDVVAPTLTSLEAPIFAKVNRPHPQIDHARMWQGLRDFCRSFSGQIRLEVMLVRGANDAPAALRALAAAVASLGTVQVDLNTVVRPPAYPEAGPLTVEELEAARELFMREGCRAAVVADPPRRSTEGTAPVALTRSRVLETVSRRPCTLDDLATALGLASSVVQAAVEAALAADELEAEERNGRRYFRQKKGRAGSPALQNSECARGR